MLKVLYEYDHISKWKMRFDGLKVKLGLYFFTTMTLMGAFFNIQHSMSKLLEGWQVEPEGCADFVVVGYANAAAVEFDELFADG